MATFAAQQEPAERKIDSKPNDHDHYGRVISISVGGANLLTNRNAIAQLRTYGNAADEHEIQH